MINRNYNNSFDGMFDFDGDGKIDMLEQYAEIDYLSGRKADSADADLAFDYMMHAKNPDPFYAASLADSGLDDDDYDDDSGFDDD